MPLGGVHSAPLRVRIAPPCRRVKYIAGARITCCILGVHGRCWTCAQCLKRGPLVHASVRSTPLLERMHLGTLLCMGCAHLGSTPLSVRFIMLKGVFLGRASNCAFGLRTRGQRTLVGVCVLLRMACARLKGAYSSMRASWHS